MPTNTLCRCLIFALKNYCYSPFTDSGNLIMCLRSPGNCWGQNPVFLASGSKVPRHLVGSYLDAFSQPDRHLLLLGCHGFFATKGKKMATVKLCDLHIIRSVEFPRWATAERDNRWSWKAVPKLFWAKTWRKWWCPGEEKVMVLQMGRKSMSAGQCCECAHCDGKARDWRAWRSRWREMSRGGAQSPQKRVI